MGAARTGEDALGEISSTLAKLSARGEPLFADTAMARTERAPHTDPPPGSPKLEGRYESIGLLGEGGMGRVEHVRDRDLLREVAVKHLLPELLSDPKLVEQFLWEARVTAHLDHPNIVPVHDLGVTPEGHLFFTMKLVRGATLEAELAKVAGAPDPEASRLNLHRRLRIFLQLCNAISFAHARGVLHRDLKPANVMVGEFGEILVTDWGIAIPLPGDSGAALREILPKGASVVGNSAGTPMYMSPEQVRGEALDARSDLYTLGVILYELVALKPAFSAGTLPALLKKVTGGDLPPLRVACPSASTAIAAVVAKAMAVEPAARYESVRALAEDVETVLDGRTPSADAAAPLVTRMARLYVARDPGMSRMRVVDLDLWMISCHFFGAGLVLVLMKWVPAAWWWWWSFLVIGVAISIRPTASWLRLRREGRDGEPPR